MNVNIRRAVFSKAYCNFPACKQKTNLSRISKSTRRFIATQEKVYISHQSVACPNHINPEAWTGVYDSIDPPSTFSAEQIEDMFDLLTNEKVKPMKTAALRTLFIF